MHCDPWALTLWEWEMLLIDLDLLLAAENSDEKGFAAAQAMHTQRRKAVGAASSGNEPGKSMRKPGKLAKRQPRGHGRSTP